MERDGRSLRRIDVRIVSHGRNGVLSEAMVGLFGPFFDTGKLRELLGTSTDRSFAHGSFVVEDAGGTEAKLNELTTFRFARNGHQHKFGGARCRFAEHFESCSNIERLVGNEVAGGRTIDTSLGVAQMDVVVLPRETDSDLNKLAAFIGMSLLKLAEFDHAPLQVFVILSATSSVLDTVGEHKDVSSHLGFVTRIRPDKRFDIALVFVGEFHAIGFRTVAFVMKDILLPFRHGETVERSVAFQIFETDQNAEVAVQNREDLSTLGGKTARLHRSGLIAALLRWKPSHKDRVQDVAAAWIRMHDTLNCNNPGRRLLSGNVLVVAQGGQRGEIGRRLNERNQRLKRLTLGSIVLDVTTSGRTNGFVFFGRRAKLDIRSVVVETIQQTWFLHWRRRLKWIRESVWLSKRKIRRRTRSKAAMDAHRRSGKRNAKRWSTLRRYGRRLLLRLLWLLERQNGLQRLLKRHSSRHKRLKKRRGRIWIGHSNSKRLLRLRIGWSVRSKRWRSVGLEVLLQ